MPDTVRTVNARLAAAIIPQQLALIRRCATLLKPGGTLVYSTCSLEPEENEHVADEAARTVPGLRLHTTRHIRP